MSTLDTSNVSKTDNSVETVNVDQNERQKIETTDQSEGKEKDILSEERDIPSEERDIPSEERDIPSEAPTQHIEVAELEDKEENQDTHEQIPSVTNQNEASPSNDKSYELDWDVNLATGYRVTIDTSIGDCSSDVNPSRSHEEIQPISASDSPQSHTRPCLTSIYWDESAVVDGYYPNHEGDTNDSSANERSANKHSKTPDLAKESIMRSYDKYRYK